MPFTKPDGTNVEITSAEQFKDIITTGNMPDGWRRGQFAFNVLLDYKPIIAESVRGTSFDPFHDDERLPQFFEHVTKCWK